MQLEILFKYTKTIKFPLSVQIVRLNIYVRGILLQLIIEQNLRDYIFESTNLLNNFKQ